MEYKDERSEDLRLHLFRGALELDAFPVLVRRRREFGDFVIDASIIGASHAVQVRIGEETLTEVLACRVTAVDLYADRLEGAWRIGEAVRMQPSLGLDYAFACEVRPLDSSPRLLEKFHGLVDEADGRNAIGLKFRFPQRTAQPPETLLHVAVCGGELRIRSLHVYPGEDVAVVSDTSLTAPSFDRRAAEELLEVGSR